MASPITDSVQISNVAYSGSTLTMSITTGHGMKNPTFRINGTSVSKSGYLTNPYSLSATVSGLVAGNTYTISADYNDNTDAAGTYTFTTTFTIPTVVHRQVFRYWAKDGLQYNFNEPVTENFTLEGVWGSVFTVHFEDSFGDPVTGWADQQVVEGEVVNTIGKPTPTRTGYTFAGWYTTDNVRWDMGLDAVMGDMTLVAIFTTT